MRKILGILALLLCGGPVAAEGVYTGAFAAASPTGAPSISAPTGPSPLSSWNAGVQGTRTDSGSYSALGAAEALAQYGIVRVSATAEATNFSGASARSVAGWFDNVQIVSDEADGFAAAIALVSIYLSGDTSSQSSGYSGGGAAVEATAKLTLASTIHRLNAFDSYFGEEEYVDGVPGNFYGMHTFAIPVYLDVNYTLSAELGCYAQAAAPIGVSVNTSCELDRSLYWAGIESVTVAGRPVSFAVLASSGTDWARSFVPSSSVPEPTTLALFGLGLAGLGFSRRKQ